MFKLKAPRSQKARINETLKIVDSADYKYVLTTDKSLTEPNKINILFQEKDLEKIAEMVETIIRSEDILVQVFDKNGQKNIESSLIDYFIVESDDVLAMVESTKYFVKMKLYEIEELLGSRAFIRVSKYAMVNINQIEYIKPALNSKLTLLMKNGDQLEVNRRYYKAFKKTLNI